MQLCSLLIIFENMNLIYQYFNVFLFIGLDGLYTVSSL